MARSAIALVKPELLIWARKNANISLDIVSKKSLIKSEKIQRWEEGREAPTVKQIKKLAKIYNQSFAAFYLPKAPELKKPQIDDFRKFPIHDIYDLPYELARELNNASDRRNIALDLIEELNEPIPQFDLDFEITDDPIIITKKVRKALGISIEEQIHWTTDRLAFNNWRDAIEKIGVLVFQSTSVALNAMRGFSLSEFPLPVIVVNRKDVYVARIFTMLHELAHLIIHKAGICDLHNEFEDGLPKKIEMFCNEFAGSILVPNDILLSENIVKAKNNYSSFEDNEINFLANKFNVSREVILRRLLIYKKISEQFYTWKKREYEKSFKKKKKTKGFVPPAINVVSLNGRPYTSLVFEALHKNRINSINVSEFLGVKSKHFEKIKQLIGMA